MIGCHVECPTNDIVVPVSSPGAWASDRNGLDRASSSSPFVAETRALIREMSKANVLWGAPRIHAFTAGCSNSALTSPSQRSPSTWPSGLAHRRKPGRHFSRTMRMASQRSISLSCRRLASSCCSGLLSWITVDAGYCISRRHIIQHRSGLRAKSSRHFHGRRGRCTFFGIGMPHTVLRIDDDLRGWVSAIVL